MRPQVCQCSMWGMLPPSPCVTLRWVAISLRGPGQSPVLPFACCVGSMLSDGRGDVPCGVVSALAEPSSWRSGVVLVVAGVVLQFLPPTPLHVQVVHSVCVRPKCSTPPCVVLVVHYLPACCVHGAQLPHLCAWCTWALRVPSWFPRVSCAPPRVARAPLLLTWVACAPVRWPGWFAPHSGCTVVLGSSHPSLSRGPSLSSIS